MIEHHKKQALKALNIIKNVNRTLDELYIKHESVAT